MSSYLEIPKLNIEFPFRCFINEGVQLVYPHWHKEIEIIYVTKGEVNIGVENKIITLKEKEIYFFRSGEIHYFLASPDSDRFVIQFDLKVFKDYKSRNNGERTVQSIFSEIENHSYNWDSNSKEKITRCIEIMLEEHYKRDKGYKHMLISKLHEILVYFYRDIQIKEKSLITPEETFKNQDVIEKLDKIFAFIEDKYKEQITIDEVARYIGFNPQYFTRFFKRYTGTTFITFLNDYRINKTKWILANETIPMIEVAEKSGFNSVKNFYHVFKEKIGMSPFRYQKSISGNNTSQNKQEKTSKF